MEKVVFVGASSKIASELISIVATHKNCHFLLTYSSKKKSNIELSNWKKKYPNSVFESLILNLNSINSIKNFESKLYDILHVKQAFLCSGILINQDVCQSNLNKNVSSFFVNGLAACLISEIFSNYFEKQGYGALCVFGSVAGDLAKKSNYSYGSAKKQLEFYLQGIRHRITNPDIQITIVKPGPTKTPMTMSLKNYNKFAEPGRVAKDTILGLEKRRNVIYTPSVWRYIMLALNFIPLFILRRFDI